MGRAPPPPCRKPWGNRSRSCKSVNGYREFMARDRSRPFCLVVALVEPHVPWVMGDPSQYPPEQLKLPPYLPDTRRTRRDYSRYLAEITYMDSQVGDILKMAQGPCENGLCLPIPVFIR